MLKIHEFEYGAEFRWNSYLSEAYSVLKFKIFCTSFVKRLKMQLPVTYLFEI
jgi:hypothetical protein